MPFASLSDIKCCGIPGVPYPRETEQQGRRAVPMGELRNSGLRYQCLLPSVDLSCFPTTFQSIILDSQSGFIGKDRGRT